MKMKSICAIEGVTAYGMKEGKFGLALIRASGTALVSLPKTSRGQHPMS